MILATQIIIGAVFVLMVIWDIIAVKKNPDATISRVIARWAKRFCMIPFTMSVLLAHFFWTWDAGYTQHIWLLVASGVIVLALSILQAIFYNKAFFKPFSKVWFIMLIVCPAGVCVGHYFWGLVI